MTPVELAAVAREIVRRRGSHVASIHQDSKTRFRLVLERGRKREDLVLDLDPRFPRVHFASHTPAPSQPTPLAARMRRRIQDGRIEGARAVPGERAMAIAIGRGRRTWSLWFEGFGRGANLYLVDPDGRVQATPRGHSARQRGASVGEMFQATKGVEPEDVAPPTLRDASAQVRTAAAQVDESRARSEREVELGRILRRERSRAQRSIRKLEKMLERGADADRLEREGRLLQASFHLLSPELSSVRVPDHEQEPPVEVEVPLQVGRDPGEQIQALFHKARKARRGTEEAERRLPQTRTRLEALDGLDGAPVEGLEAGLLDLGIRLAGAARPRRKEAPASDPWMTFTSVDGWRILVGRDAQANDALTGRKARASDLFLHVRGSPGSHVIVPRPPDKTVPLPTLLDAAELALYFSRRRGAPFVEVDYAERRYVRKPRGAQPGTVVLHRSRTLRLETDADRRERVLGSRAK